MFAADDLNRESVALSPSGLARYTREDASGPLTAYLLTVGTETGARCFGRLLIRWLGEAEAKQAAERCLGNGLPARVLLLEYLAAGTTWLEWAAIGHPELDDYVESRGRVDDFSGLVSWYKALGAAQN